MNIQKLSQIPVRLRPTNPLATLRLFPGITVATVQAFLAPPVRGVVLETFGSGNAPQRKDLMSALREACERGVVIVAITQCTKGSVSDTYETGRTLLRVGVVPGGDMTPEVRVSRGIKNETKTEGMLAVRADEAQLPPLQTRALCRAGAQPRRRTTPRRADARATRGARVCY